MTLLILGVLLWSVSHSFKRLLPAQRAALGERGKGLVALASGVSVVLMVVGFRTADGPVFWDRSAMTVGINNGLMLVSVYLFAASGMKLGVTRRMRHPMLTGFGLWALAHILVNGDLASIILFGGLGLWAVAAARSISAAEPIWEKPAPKPAKKELIGVGAALVTYGVFAGVHYALGHPAFG
jgi:uncharacterized membrane protein